MPSRCCRVLYSIQLAIMYYAPCAAEFQIPSQLLHPHNSALHTPQKLCIPLVPASLSCPWLAGWLTQSTLSTCGSSCLAQTAPPPPPPPPSAWLAKTLQGVGGRVPFPFLLGGGTNLQNTGLISTDRSNKATLLLTIPCFKIKVVCNGFIFSNI